MAWNAMDALNRNTQAAVTDERPKARFRVRDINIKKMYSNDANFYSMQDVEQLAQKIYAVGLLENLTVVHDPFDAGLETMVFRCDQNGEEKNWEELDDMHYGNVTEATEGHIRMWEKWTYKGETGVKVVLG